MGSAHQGQATSPPPGAPPLLFQGVCPCLCWSFLFPVGSFLCLSEYHLMYLTQEPPVWKHPGDECKLKKELTLPPASERPSVQDQMLLAECQQAAMPHICTSSSLAHLSGRGAYFNSSCVWERRLWRHSLLERGENGNLGWEHLVNL